MYSIGSTSHQLQWKQDIQTKTPEAVLTDLLNHIGMPDELSGDLAENQRLVAQFDEDLAPHDPFWKDLARLVRRQMKHRDFREKTAFNRRLHQLRYVISAQQAQYVRWHYKKQGQTDRDALIAYLVANRLRPSLVDNARLHNKRQSRDGILHFPEERESYNIKVLLALRTEFILDSQGNFLNEVDAEEVTPNGIINGASFNYGNTPKSHVTLDVRPIRPHDPAFRKAITKGYKSPNRLGRIHLGRFLKERQQADYALSFFNKTGAYAKNGKALVAHIKQAKKAFKQALWQAKR